MLFPPDSGRSGGGAGKGTEGKRQVGAAEVDGACVGLVSGSSSAFSLLPLNPCGFLCATRSEAQQGQCLSEAAHGFPWILLCVPLQAAISNSVASWCYSAFPLTRFPCWRQICCKKLRIGIPYAMLNLPVASKAAFHFCIRLPFTWGPGIILS